MSVEFFRQNWALGIAAILLAVVAIIVVVTLYRRSATSQLSRTAKAARAARDKLAKAKKAADAAEKRARRLHDKASSVKPRLLQEAKEAMQDARALQKIAGDQVLVADNHLRRVIYEEYPPSRHESLRMKHLPDDKPNTNPFSF
ncbi:MAG: hypothetical protein KJO82_00430 [Gammaproteobacteria bacterium]|nr:hypothetical protein [Gammaproteobacteria bacterium]